MVGSRNYELNSIQIGYNPDTSPRITSTTHSSKIFGRSTMKMTAASSRRNNNNHPTILLLIFLSTTITLSSQHIIGLDCSLQPIYNHHHGGQILSQSQKGEVVVEPSITIQEAKV
jgi:hypothetical protein